MDRGVSPAWRSSCEWYNFGPSGGQRVRRPENLPTADQNFVPSGAFRTVGTAVEDRRRASLRATRCAASPRAVVARQRHQKERHRTQPERGARGDKRPLQRTTGFLAARARRNLRGEDRLWYRRWARADWIRVARRFGENHSSRRPSARQISRPVLSRQFAARRSQWYAQRPARAANAAARVRPLAKSSLRARSAVMFLASSTIGSFLNAWRRRVRARPKPRSSWTGRSGWHTLPAALSAGSQQYQMTADPSRTGVNKNARGRLD